MKESITINKVGLISTANNTPAITIVLGLNQIIKNNKVFEHWDKGI